MGNFIKSIRLHNYCRFRELSLEFDEYLNLFIGDNESGKSTILSAIDLVLSGSRSKVETIGLDKLFNINSIDEFFQTTRTFNELPHLFIELFLDDQGLKELEGRSNPSGKYAHGIFLYCEPAKELSKEIIEILKQDEKNFPFEYYSISFKTFSGESYSGYRKFLKHLVIENTKISNDYATRSYINTVYQSFIDGSERNKNLNEYRKYKNKFKDEVLKTINKKISDYSFAIKSNSMNNLETDLTITENNIDIANMGLGRQCFIRTEFALQKNGKDLDVILLEEPENHLSHINMHKLINRIKESDTRQIFISTHSDLISTRLDLRKSILLNSNSCTPLLLNDLDEETAKFFMKAPDNNVLEYIMSDKAILVEGNAEFILMKQLYKNICGSNIEDDNIHIISVGGTSFKRYLDIANILEIKTAVIRDNDGNYKENIENSFSEYTSDYVKIFSEENDDIRTFEIALYNLNQDQCDTLFEPGRRSLTVLEYMLSNKAECAFQLLDKSGNNLITPEYIQRAVKWINT